MKAEFPSIAASLSHVLRTPVNDTSRRPVSGGSINRAYEYVTAHGRLFVKAANTAEAVAMFEAEAAGLRALAAVQAVRVPRVVSCGQCTEGAYLALEWIQFGKSSRSSEATLGEQLAWQHRSTRPQFGWDRDNTIGATPQSNPWCADWVAFYQRHRLAPQLALATHNGAPAEMVERGQLLSQLCGAFFSSYRPVPSLLHGDLWSGNWGSDEDGHPVIFDPAVYYGDREADIAMTRLFGGFGPAFYAAYQSTWPLDAAAGTRATLYNLYHVLNHFNLFGGEYLGRAQQMIDRLLAELGH